jgi:hypothetical protein
MNAAGRVDDQTLRADDEEAERFAMSVRAGVISTEPPPPEWMTDWVYADPPAGFDELRAEALDG